MKKISKQKKVEIKNINASEISGNYNQEFSEKIQEYEIEMRLPKISIPKLLNFLIALEKSDRFLGVKDIKITGLYGNKLYFDTKLLLTGYKSR